MHSQDEILSYREMCYQEDVQTLQRGMNYRLNPHYSVILMSQRANAPYQDKVQEDGVTIEYEGHDVNRNGAGHDPKLVDQPVAYRTGKLTQNGKFIDAVRKHLQGELPELVKVYEKVMPGIWSLKGFFDLIGVQKIDDGNRNVFRFTLKLSKRNPNVASESKPQLEHSRVIPAEVKKKVWKRDGGKCVLCGSTENLHFDHDLPFSKGGTSLSASNVRILCMKHNLAKSAKIE